MTDDPERPIRVLRERLERLVRRLRGDVAASGDAERQAEPAWRELSRAVWP